MTFTRPHKYRAQPTEVDGIRFASKAEARRYGELKILEHCELIGKLEVQPRFDIVVNNIKCGFYKADFRYYDVKKGCRVVEDVKGKPGDTALYRLKKKLVEAIYGITITEVK